MKGLTERISAIFKKHNISTSFKPHTNIRNVVAHPRDKIRVITETTAYMKYLVPTPRKSTSGKQGENVKPESKNTRKT